MGSYQDEDSYAGMDLNDLILICIDDVTSRGEDCTFERLVYECFTRFPKALSFSRYTHWPDSNRLDRPLRTLRQKGLIVGSPKIAFLLTDYGREKATNAKKFLELGTKTKHPQRVLRGKERNLLAYIRGNQAYQRFSQGKIGFAIDEQEFIDLLRGTLETPKLVLRQNLAQLKSLANESQDEEVKQFLEICEKQMAHIFRETKGA
jgi:hypothetical protein